MSTNSSALRRGQARERRFKHLKSEGKREIRLKKPKRKLNPDQQAIRLVLEHDFFGNRELMSEEVGMSSGGIARYTQRGISSPDWDLMQRVAKAVHSTVEQLRAEGAGHDAGLYIASTGEWVDRDDPKWEEIRLRLINWASSDSDEEIDL